ncbi:MAG: hypothetical protein JST84_13750 [Acidobacteria bacterium]|nr:hypothetical protein [Acidobacteriota bacterium]
MVRKYLTCFLILLLLNFQLFAQTKAEKKAAAHAEKLKTSITTVGTGDTAPAELKLKSGGKLIGYVSEVKDRTVIFAETKAAKSHELSYAEINSLKAYNPKNRSHWKWYILTGVILTAVTVIAIKECQKRERRGETCAVDENTY